MSWWRTKRRHAALECRHFEYVPQHRTLAVPLVNPEGNPGFFVILPLPIISAGAFERALPTAVFTAVVQQSRN